MKRGVKKMAYQSQRKLISKFLSENFIPELVDMEANLDKSIDYVCISLSASPKLVREQFELFIRQGFLKERDGMISNPKIKEDGTQS
jgi:hypothetical protein